jgi:hypothetical protein
MIMTPLYFKMRFLSIVSEYLGLQFFYKNIAGRIRGRR